MSTSYSTETQHIDADSKQEKIEKSIESDEDSVIDLKVNSTLLRNNQQKANLLLYESVLIAVLFPLVVFSVRFLVRQEVDLSDVALITAVYIYFSGLSLENRQFRVLTTTASFFFIIVYALSYGYPYPYDLLETIVILVSLVAYGIMILINVILLRNRSKQKFHLMSRNWQNS